MTRAAGLVLILLLAGCAGPIPDVGTDPPAKPVERLRFEPIPIPLTPPFWKLL